MTETYEQRYREFAACGPIVNWHEHVWTTPDGVLNEALLDEMMEYAGIFGFSKLVISLPVVTRHCDTMEMRGNNDIVYDALNKYKGRLYGMCYLDPGLTSDVPAELERCLDHLGFIGVKLYNQYTIDDPIQDEIIRLCACRKKPVLMHATKLNMFSDGQPFASHGTHFARAAMKHPDATFILAHIGGGGDWYWQVKSVAPYDNVLVDMSGSIHDAGMVEYAVEKLGADRVLFGTDGSFASCIGKMCAARLSHEQRKTILEGTRLAHLLRENVGP